MMTILIKQPTFTSPIRIENVDRITYLENSKKYFIDLEGFSKNRLINADELILVSNDLQL